MPAEGQALNRPEVARQRPASRFSRPIRHFLETEIAGGVLLIAAIVVALVWANSPLSDSYEELWSTKAGFSVGGFSLEHDLRHWVNDGLMVLFFFVVGMEIKRELVAGELAGIRKVLLPGVAAAGGMILPALLFLSLNPTGEATRGWGIPMATDIALALGVLSLFGSRIPHQLRILLLSIAIVDDIGAVLVIAVFYTEKVSLSALVLALLLLGLVAALRLLRVWWTPLYVIVGAGAWLAMMESGVHPTVAGVALGLLTPARPLRPGLIDDSLLEKLFGKEQDDEPEPKTASETTERIKLSLPPTERLGYKLHPWTSFLIVPIFALANTGLQISPSALWSAFGSSVTLGIILGLVAGKTAGIFGSSLLAARSGAALPEGVGRRQLIGMSSIGGIGLTMSLFIASLAFESGGLLTEAKVGILVGSFVSGLLGAAILSLRLRSH